MVNYAPTLRFQDTICCGFSLELKASQVVPPEQPRGCEEVNAAGQRRDRRKGAAKTEKGRKSERSMPRLSGGEEGRGKLRKAAGICKQELIRGYPNGATRQVEDLSPS